MITSAPASLEKGLKVRFLEYFSQESQLAPRIAFVESSDSDKESYEWLGEAPAMSELRDERKITPLSSTSYEIKNKTFTSTIAVKRSDIADNKSGSINRRIAQMAAAAAGHQNKLLVDALVSGTSDLCFDGAAFFSNSHPNRGDSGVQDNLLAGSGSTASQVAGDLSAAKAAMMRFLNESGNPHAGDGAMDLAVVCPPDLEKVFREVLNAQIISNTSNVQAGMADLIVSPRLSDTNDWYLLRTDSTSRGLVFQEREPIEFTALEAGSDRAFHADEWYYGVRARYAVGYAHWAAAIKTVNS